MNENLKKEAIKRMQLLGINKEEVAKFEETGRPYQSSKLILSDDERKLMEEKIQEFETERKALVYAIIPNDFLWIRKVGFLFVCEHDKEWWDDEKIQLLTEKHTPTYDLDLDQPENSDFSFEYVTVVSDVLTILNY